jgi:hypothetical protein
MAKRKKSDTSTGKATAFKAESKPASPTEVLQFKIKLKNVDPPIWRRIQVPDCTLAVFHWNLQKAMGWDNAHLYQFTIDGKEFTDPEMADGSFDEFETGDSKDVCLSQLFPTGARKSRFTYLYDFGDGWEHEIAYEKRVPAQPGAVYPLCTEGARACPPEDCGGPWGYTELLEALEDPTDPDNADRLEWCGPLDPEKFDTARISEEMRGRTR